ncbi:MAG: diacylglycerol kinase family lipid kinase [Bacteroidales bacterium]|jgi:YegS/Rv2252/BmrU family lipid kinase|nr:diacylglycerol kinase family lipid kinase [Bacteroidales bacterium]
MKRNLLFIVNPISGIGRQKKIEALLESNIDHSLLDYTVRYTERIHHGTELAKDAVEQGCFDAIVAVGGDGSVNDVVSGMVGSNIALGIIPCGSGNGLARNLKIPLTPAHAIEILNHYKVAEIDTIYLNDRVIASIAGIGFDARVARRMKQTKVRGLQAYAKIILTDYPTYKEHTYRLNIDGNEIERKAWFISFANSNQFGYNTAIAPLAQLDDGLIDVCIVDRIPLLHLPMTAPLLYLNHFELSQHVEYFKAHEVTVYNNDEKWVNIDGEGERIGTELHFRNVRKSLKVLVP